MFVGCAQACNKVILERLDGTFGSVALMRVWGYELEVDVLVLDGAFECVGGFVIKFLEAGLETTVDKVLVQFVVGA